MTDEEAVRLLWVERVFARMVDGSEFVLLKPTAAKKISELIERQATEIERLQPKVCKKMCLNVTDKVTGVCSHEPYCRKAQDLMEKVERLQAEKELAKEAIAIVWAEKEKLKSKCESLQKGFDLNG